MRNNFTLKTTFLLILFFSVLSTFSQERTCGTEEYMQEKLQDPVFAEEYYQRQQEFQARLQEILANQEFQQRDGNATIIIPVAVHYPSANEADRACLVALAQNQIDILNADYTATNSDLSLWPSASAFYPSVTPTGLDVSFALATSNHPVGLDPELVEGEPCVTIGYNWGGGGDSDSNWSGYMNFVVRPIGGGILGYSPLGGSSAAGHTVVIDPSYFGSGSGCPGSGAVPTAPYNLGRTVTHELGHFFNLNHTFSGSCGSDDGIADTPNISNPNYGCPANGSVNGCVTGEKALTMNYMDYVNDACMYMFTLGQANVMNAYLTGILEPQFHDDVFGPVDPGFNISGSNVATCGDEAVFNLTYSQVGGFSENTVFTASGNPGGTSVVFSPNNLSSNGNFTMTVTGLSGVADGNYTITVTGTSASITDSNDFVLTIADQYCASVANTTYATSTTGVVFNTISNLNTGKPSGYSDYTGISTDVNRESAYDLSVYANSDGNYQIITYVWIDWNQNCSFDDAGEQYDLGTSANINNQLTVNSPYSITIPSDAVLGNTTMRITTKYTDPGANQFPTSCENGHDAEVEDYSLNILTSLSVGEVEFSNFALYPNPNNGEFSIRLTSISDKDINVDVFDIRGRKIFEQSYENTYEFSNSVKLNSVQPGIYLVKIEDGISSVTRKIVVE